MNWRNQGVKALYIAVGLSTAAKVFNSSRKDQAYTKMTYMDTKGHWKREKSNAEMMSHCLLSVFLFWMQVEMKSSPAHETQLPNSTCHFK